MNFNANRAAGAVFILIALLFLLFPRPRFYHVNKSGVVLDASTNKPLQGVTLAYGFERVCGGLGGATGRHTEIATTTTDNQGHYHLKGTLFSFDWISTAMFLSGCWSEAQEYVCKPGYAPQTTTFDWYQKRRWQKFSPIKDSIQLSASTAPYKYSSRFNLLGDLKRDCKVEIDFGLGRTK